MAWAWAWTLDGPITNRKRIAAYLRAEVEHPRAHHLPALHTYLDLLFDPPGDGTFTREECWLAAALAADVIEAGDFPVSREYLLVPVEPKRGGS